MTIPTDNQTVHLMNWYDILRIRWRMRREEGRNWQELKLYTTDDLRRRYQDMDEMNFVQLRDGLLHRNQLVAEIRVRIFLERFFNFFLFWATVVAAIASIIAAVEGWKP